eukprot:5064255-Amphidinium_carterae.1
MRPSRCILRHMSLLKAGCQLVEPQVQESHQTDFNWHPHAHNMVSQMIRNDGARKQCHVGVQTKKNTRC